MMQFTKYMAIRQLKNFERTPERLNLLDEFVAQVSSSSGPSSHVYLGGGKTIWIYSITDFSFKEGSQPWLFFLSFCNHIFRQPMTPVSVDCFQIQCGIL